jgi:ABC-2 type transport system ATP-binding protein
MTVFDYLKFFADLRHIKNSDERINHVLESVQMQSRSKGYIANLSKGMRQRVGLAQALIHEPEVLILDEPTLGLDPAQIIEVRNLIRNLRHERTVLLSTHILSEAQQICDRVLIINKGTIVAEDTPERLQASLTGSSRILIKVRGDNDGLENVVISIPGVIQVNSNLDGSLELEITPGNEIRPEVARVVINAGFDLLELRESNLSLEDMFMQLTRMNQPCLSLLTITLIWMCRLMMD